MNNPRNLPIRFCESKIEKRFWSKVNIGKYDDCWEWNASTNGAYGQMLIYFLGRPFTAKAHRLAFFYYSKIDPFDNLVCHRCDNPKCCNPNHLFLGSNLINILDAKSKGRLATGIRNGRHTHPESTPRGSKRWSSKLSEDKVLEIRSLHKDGKLGCRRLAKRFGVRAQTILAIIHRKTWVHI